MAYKRSFSNKNTSNTSSSNDAVIELDKKKQITVRKFNNVNLVDIREFYVDKDTNEKKPGKKGISLTEDVWLKLVQSSSDVQDALDVLNGVEPSRKKAKQTENNDDDAADAKAEANNEDQKTDTKEEEDVSDEDAE